MESTALIAASAYLITGFVALAVATRGDVFQWDAYGLLVILAWPLFLAMLAVERGFRPGPMDVRPRHRLEADPVAVGQVGVTASDLRPAGKVEIGGRSRDARADGHVARGMPVVVVGCDQFGLLVQPVTPVPDLTSHHPLGKP